MIADAASYGVMMSDLVIDNWRDRQVVFNRWRYGAERKLAEAIKEFADNWKGRRIAQKLVVKAADASDIELTDAQIAALKTALLHPVSIITGGPGTGKTTILRTLARMVGAENIAACAVAGRADFSG